MNTLAKEAIFNLAKTFYMPCQYVSTRKRKDIAIEQGQILCFMGRPFDKINV